MIDIKRLITGLLIITMLFVQPCLCQAKAEEASTTRRTENVSNDVVIFTYTNDEVWSVVNVNFRRNHNENAEKICLIIGDTKLERIGTTSNNWSLIKYKDELGFVHSDYLTNEEPVVIIEDESEDDLEYFGSCKITGYTSDPADNGGYYGDSFGRPLIPWYGCASDLPFGTMLYIEGLGVFEVRDRGVRGKHIDIVTNSNSESYAITGYYDVYIMR